MHSLALFLLLKFGDCFDRWGRKDGWKNGISVLEGTMQELKWRA
jgi:hypothetical protein